MSRTAPSFETFQLPIRSPLPTPPPSSAKLESSSGSPDNKDVEMSDAVIFQHHKVQPSSPPPMEHQIEINFFSDTWFDKMEMPTIPPSTRTAVLKVDFHDTLHDDSNCCELDLPIKDLAEAVREGSEHLTIHVHFKRFRYALFRHWTCMNYFEYILQKSETLQSYEIIFVHPGTTNEENWNADLERRNNGKWTKECILWDEGRREPDGDLSGQRIIWGDE